MKCNLIFGGIEQTALDYEEETEAVLKEFIKTELEIPVCRRFIISVGYCWLTV
jgi:hypothetical protein